MEEEIQKINKLRPVHAELETLTRPDGSSMFNMGRTSVMVAGYGPVTARPQKLLYDRACVEVVYKPRVGMSGIEDRQKEYFLRKVCETSLLTVMHPGSSVTVVLQEMNDDGGLLSCCANATCLALLSMGFPMRVCFAAAGCCVSSDGELILDPNKRILKESVAQFEFVFNSTDASMISSHTQGQFSADQFRKAVGLCQAASCKMMDFFQKCMEKAYINKIGGQQVETSTLQHED